MPNLIPSLDAPAIASPTPIGKPIVWGGAPSFNRITKEFDITPDGQIVMLNDYSAFIQWVWKSLVTARRKFRIYTYKGNAVFGNDFVALIGLPYHDVIKESVAVRFCREALEFDSRIDSIPVVTAQLVADYITIYISIKMVAGRELQFQQSWVVK